MQRLEQILQWKLYTGGGRDSSEVTVSQFSKDVAACLAFGFRSLFCELNFLFFCLKMTGFISCGILYIQVTDLFLCSPQAKCVDQVQKYKYSRFQALAGAG